MASPAAANQAAWRALYDRIEPGEKLAAADFTRAAQFLRPSLIGLYHRKNVLVADITLFNFPMWMRHPVYCDDVVVRGIRFVSADPEGPTATASTSTPPATSASPIASSTRATTAS